MAGNYQILLDHGAATCNLMGANADFTQLPAEAVWRAAIPCRAKSLAQISANTAAGLLAVKQMLTGGDVETFSIVVYNNFVTYPAAGPRVHDQVLSANASGVYVPPRNLSANHALTMVGYDETKTYHLDDETTRSVAFLVVNSWGTGWGCVEPTVGTAGFIWLGYDYFMSNVSSPVYMMVDRAAPTMTFEVLPRAGGDRWMNVRVVADATDFYNAGYLSYWLNVSDQHVPSLFPGVHTGTLKYFAIELPGLMPWVCPDVPADTINFEPSQPITADNGYIYRNISFFRPHGAVFEGREFNESSHA